MSTQNTNTRGTVILFLVVGAGMLVYWWAGNHFWPPKPPTPPLDRDKQELVAAASAIGLAQPGGESWNAVAFLAAAQTRGEKPAEKPAEKVVEKPPQKPAPEAPVDPEMLKVVTLGAPGSHLTVKINPHGAGVLQIVFEHFQAANPKTGEPEWLDADHKIKKPLELVPADKNTDVASFLLYHYGNPLKEDYPLDTLGKRVWKRVTPEKVDDNEPVREAVFETEVQGVSITKKYTLEPRNYHVGLEVSLKLVDPQTKEKVFRYQLTGAHGVPIEGEWYASLFRNVLIGRVYGNGKVDRDFQALQQIAVKGGGDEVAREEGKGIRYAMVANQFFASGIAVATKDQDDKDFLAQARPVLLDSAAKGKVVKVSDEADGRSEVEFRDATGTAHLFYIPEEVREEDRERVRSALVPGADLIIRHRSLIARSGATSEVITNVFSPNETAPVFHDDVTVEVSTAKDDQNVIRLKAGADPVVHKYVLYNGPVKVRLLDDHLFGQEPAVDPSEVAYYINDLHLDTLTDYHSPGTLSTWMSYTPWTGVVIWFTNRMHDVLWFLYCVVQYVTPTILVYGLCILLLTVMVRAAMHPVSRKQARMTMKMQALQPELAKLKEKHKDDKQALGMAQMELYRRHGINPMGSCWLMLLQMPVFLGLYYCLQESIHFRLAPFLYIRSLTAPDMLIHWGDKIPWLSTWNDYGWFLYLGPYFNLLPVVAVALMILQQKYTMPPATDEQQAMQQKMMKYMMVFFGLMFYKVAAGLCLYFIASSLWGFAERKLLPKRKPGEPLTPPAATGRMTLMQRMLERLQDAQRGQGGRGNGTAGGTNPPPVPPGGGKKKRGRSVPASPAPTGGDGLLARVRAWWAEVLRQAEKR